MQTLCRTLSRIQLVYPRLSSLQVWHHSRQQAHGDVQLRLLSGLSVIHGVHSASCIVGHRFQGFTLTYSRGCCELRQWKHIFILIILLLPQNVGAYIH
jgi:hypothetical protein